jgi:lipooligosaccharide transport system ATP-binding protein
MDEAEQLCDRLVVMDRGRIVAEGSPRDLIARHSTREVVEARPADGETAWPAEVLASLAARIEVLPDRVLLYTDNGDDTAAAVTHHHELNLASVLVRRSSLEDVFLRLTGRMLVD